MARKIDHNKTDLERRLRERMLSGDEFTYGDVAAEFAPNARGNHDAVRDLEWRCEALLEEELRELEDVGGLVLRLEQLDLELRAALAAVDLLDELPSDAGLERA